MPEKPKVLILFGASGRLIPDAGPIQSINALLDGLRDRFDLGFAAGATLKPRRHADVAPDHWAEMHGVSYHWVSQGHGTRRMVRQLLAERPWDLVVLGSFFDREFTLPVLVLRRLGLVRRMPVVLAPRGELSGGALSLKPGRKRLWISLLRALGLTRDIWFHATAAHERADIAALGLPCRGILDAPDTAALPPPPAALSAAEGARAGPLRVVFLGRIAPVKNITFALDVLARVAVPVQFDLFGPLDDPAYWQACAARIAALPAHVTVTRHAPLAHHQVIETLARHDLLFLPSKGENFGHAVHEALAAGLPVLLSDTTPWSGLAEAGAGWDLPLDDPALFARKIEQLAALDPAPRHAMRLAARRFVEARHRDSAAIEKTGALFLTAIKASHA